jgi:hypothetical protein
MSPPAPSRPAPNGTSASTRHPQPAPGFRDAARLVLEHQAGTALPSWSDHRDVASLASLAPALVRRQDTAAASEHRADRPRQARSALSCAMPTIVCAADRVWVEAEPRSTLYEVGPGVTFSSVRHASPAPRVIRTFGSKRASRFERKLGVEEGDPHDDSCSNADPDPDCGSGGRAYGGCRETSAGPTTCVFLGEPVAVGGTGSR